MTRSIQTAQGTVTLTINADGDTATLRGANGTHEVWAPAHDGRSAARIAKHWAGFIANHGGALPTPPKFRKLPRIYVVVRLVGSGSWGARTVTEQVYPCDVLGTRNGYTVVAGRVWKSRTEQRIMLAAYHGGALHRQSQWTHGNAPAWVKAMAKGTRWEVIA